MIYAVVAINAAPWSMVHSLFVMTREGVGVGQCGAGDMCGKIHVGLGWVIHNLKVE